MNHVSIRVYGPLNDFLPPGRRQSVYPIGFEGRTTMKDLIERIGVPHPEVDLVLANGKSVAFERIVLDADRISVFPRFHAVDITTVTLVRARRLDAIRFVLDGHLAKLARYLRLVGLDATCPPGADDNELASLAAGERRIVLTRDVALLKRSVIAHGRFVRETIPQRQLVEVLEAFEPLPLAPFTRCPRCNAALSSVSKAAVEDRLPARTRCHYDEFRVCDGCGRVFWKGAHWRRLTALVDHALGESSSC